MIKRFIILLAFIFLPVWAWGATYYVNTTTGANGNSGTSASTPKASLNFVNNLTAAGDTVNIIAPATHPVREGLSPVTAGSSGNVITYQGTSATDKAYITTLKDVSHGATVGNYLDNGDLEGWLSSSSLWALSGDAAVTREGAIIDTGTYSAKFVRSGSDIRLWNNTASAGMHLPGATSMALSFRHYETEATYRFQWSLKDMTDNTYLQTDMSTWNSTFAYHDPGAGSNSTGAWATTSASFTSNHSGIYQLSIWLRNNTTSYLDNVVLTTSAGTYSWSLVSGHNYYILNTKLPMVVSMLGKSSATAWAATGIEALTWVTKAADLATCDSTPGTWWYDSTNFDLYYTPATGEDITALHLEASLPRFDARTYASSAVDINKQYIALKYIKTALSSLYQFYFRAANWSATSIEGVYGIATLCYITASGTGTDVVTKYGKGSGATHADGILVSGTGIIVDLYKPQSWYAGDDGIQSASGATMNLYYPLSVGAGLEQDANSNCGIVAEDANSAMNVYNATVYGAYGPGIERGSGSGNSTVKNSIIWGNVTGGGAGKKNVENQDNGTGLTASNNIYQDQYQWTTDATDIMSDPLFRNAVSGDFRLRSGSPAINAGTDVGLTTDILGRPIRGVPDIGAYEFYGSGGRTLLGVGQ
jgi:hypothetical protein